jgi:phosphopantothenoylcysteine decarboxylase/phosphopantothenate--cysteine ligase
MHASCIELFAEADITIMAAAVADYTPLNPESEKIKKKDKTLSLNLLKTKDILADLGQQKQKGQLLVGFALETNNEIENAIHKLHTKNLDFIVLNSLKDAGSGFGVDTNKISIIGKDQVINEFTLKTKSEAAVDIFDSIQKAII